MSVELGFGSSEQKYTTLKDQVGDFERNNYQILLQSEVSSKTIIISDQKGLRVKSSPVCLQIHDLPSKKWEAGIKQYPICLRK